MQPPLNGEPSNQPSNPSAVDPETGVPIVQHPSDQQWRLISLPSPLKLPDSTHRPLFGRNSTRRWLRWPWRRQACESEGWEAELL